ncbi:hypothetical protein [Pararhodobacter sp.]|uniref:hypothetical protein n=1 Tax=Pararhodobacter sp. TaxID=2127056 RepID=UPI002FE03A70|nr:hypothetical protein [Pseudomonadota bacterium]
MPHPLILAPFILGIAVAAAAAAVHGPGQSSGSAVLTLTTTAGDATGVSGEVTLSPLPASKVTADDSAAPGHGTFGRIVLLRVATTAATDLPGAAKDR